MRLIDTVSLIPSRQTLTYSEPALMMQYGPNRRGRNFAVLRTARSLFREVGIGGFQLTRNRLLQTRARNVRELS